MTTMTADTIGRKTKLTPERHTQIVTDVTNGNTLEASAALAGIGRTALFRWIERGTAELERLDQGITPYERAQQGLPTATREARFADFADAVMRARAEAEAAHVGNVKRVAMGGFVVEETEELDENGNVRSRTKRRAAPDWRASAFWLERARVQQWGRRTTLDVQAEHQVGGTVQVELSEGGRIAARLEDFQRRVAANPGMLDAAADEAFGRRVIDISPERLAIGVGQSGSDTADLEDTDGGASETVVPDQPVREVDSYTVRGDQDEPSGGRPLSASISRKTDPQTMRVLPAWVLQSVPVGWALVVELDEIRTSGPPRFEFRWDTRDEVAEGGALDAATECAREVLGAVAALRGDLREAVAQYVKAVERAQERHGGVDLAVEAHIREQDARVKVDPELVDQAAGEVEARARREQARQ